MLKDKKNIIILLLSIIIFLLILGFIIFFITNKLKDKSSIDASKLSTTKLSEMLDTYYENNKDKVEYIDTEELLKSFR